MKVVFKYDVQPVDIQNIELPIGAEILCVQMQREQLSLWALVDSPATGSEFRTIIMMFTGERLHSSLGKYLGTVQLHSGNLVLHFFEAVSS